MRTIIVFFGLCCANFAWTQQMPVSLFKIISSDPNETPLTFEQQLAKTFPQLEAASFNYGSVFLRKPGGTFYSDAQILQLLDSAAAHNVKIILHHLLERYAMVERFYFDASDNYFNYIRIADISPDAATEQPDPPFDYDQASLRATVANDYMVRDIKYQPVYDWNCCYDYRAYFRLKADITGQSSTTPVVDIEVRDITSGSSIIQTLTVANFSTSNTYYLFAISFNSGGISTGSSPSGAVQSMPLGIEAEHAGAPHVFDLRVKWHGQVPVWLDNIRVDGSFSGSLDDAVTLFSGGFDNTIKTTAKKFNAHPALARFYLRDEPYFNQFRAFNAVNQRLRDAAIENGVNPSTGKGLGHTAFREHIPGPNLQDTYGRTIQETGAHELSTDIYRFLAGHPLPSADNYAAVTQQSLQTAIERFKLANQNSIHSGSGTWWYYPTITQWPGQTREPYLSEIYSQVHLALTYGAKGIFYFHYWSVPSANIIGLIDPATLDPINSNSPYSIYGEDKWDGIAALNQKLAGPLGTTLMNLTWQDAISRHTLSSPLNKFSLLGGAQLTNVTADSDDPTVTYVEVGHLKNVSTGEDYLMVVNRRTHPNDTRTISLVFNNSTPWALVNVETGSSVTIGMNGTYAASFAPGEGRLLKIIEAPAVVPTLVSPADGATNVSTSPTLSWNSSSGATSYRLQVSATSNFSSLVVDQPNITGTSLNVNLSYSTQYWWRVNAANGSGTSEWSAVWSFTTVPAPPAAPTLASPANGATGASISPVLIWNTSSGAASYWLQVATVSNFSSGIVYNQSNITSTSQQVSGLAHNTTYYWRVRAINDGGDSDWSSTWSFTTESRYFTLTLNSPCGFPVSGAGTYEEGTVVNVCVTSTVVSGGSGIQYVFTNWSGDASGTSTCVNVTMDGNKTVTANCRTQYFLSVTSSCGLPTAGEGWYDEGTVATACVTSTERIEGGTKYQFTGWSGDASGTSSCVNILMDRAKAVTATCDLYYLLTVSSPYGSTTGQGYYLAGTTAYAGVSPAVISGGTGIQHMFTNWGGAASGPNASQSSPIVMTEPKTAEAIWKTQYHLTVNAPSYFSPSGSGWYDAGSIAYACLGSTFYIQGNTRYYFTGWSGDASGMSTCVNVTMNGAKTVTAQSWYQYWVEITAGTGGSVSPASGWYDPGEVIEISASASPGYHFLRWEGVCYVSYSGPSPTAYIEVFSDCIQQWAYFGQSCTERSEAPWAYATTDLDYAVVVQWGEPSGSCPLRFNIYRYPLYSGASWELIAQDVGGLSLVDYPPAYGYGYNDYAYRIVTVSSTGQEIAETSVLGGMYWW